jgi:hypothetical protein
MFISIQLDWVWQDANAHLTEPGGTNQCPHVSGICSLLTMDEDATCSPVWHPFAVRTKYRSPLILLLTTEMMP